MELTPFPLVVYDDDCGFCNRFVLFVLAREHAERYHFTPLTGERAAKFFAEHHLEPGEAMWLIRSNTEYYAKSGAALRIMGSLRGGWRLALLFLITPRFIRDRVYDFIASRRKQILRGKICPLPAPEHQSRFI